MKRFLYVGFSNIFLNKKVDQGGFGQFGSVSSVAKARVLKL